MVSDELVRTIVERVVGRLRTEAAFTVPVEISARHVHLSQAHVEQLFGSGYSLTRKRDISQPGQFLCEERVRLVGPKGVFENVAVLGPVRKATQVEISATDARQLGLKAPLRMSGDLAGAADAIITAGDALVVATGSVIVAKNHVHMTPDDARRYGVANGEQVGIRIAQARPIVFENVTIRVDVNCRLAMHIDFDEANACLCRADTVGTLLHKAGEEKA